MVSDHPSRSIRRNLGRRSALEWKKAYVMQKTVERPKQIEIGNQVLNRMTAFVGVIQLIAYRFALGLEYATFGLVDRANKYCEALEATFKLATKPCPFYHPFLFEQIKTLSGRLSAAPLAEKGSSWITRKMPRLTLDNVWQTLEGRVHKFVAGDDDDGSNPVASKSIGPSSQNSKVLGPFSHYSSISPESVSGTVSRVQSSNDLGQISTQTTTSGLAGPFHHNATLQRPSSGAGYSPSYYSKDPRRASPSNQYEGSTLSPVDYASFRGQTSSVPPLHSYEHAAPAGSPSSVPSPGETVTADNITTTSGGWWESSNSYGTPANNTSQPVFESIADTPIADDGSGFIDPMASFGGPSFVSPGAPMRESPHPIAPSPSSRTQYDEDEEDLGFGNSSSRKQDKRGSGSMDRNSGATDSPSSHNNTEKNEPTSSETESGNKRRWFKRDSGGQAAPGSGPVKANLGEDFSLVYDPETKRWVNKKAGASQSPSRGGAPPPPPTRAQTASPTSSMRSTLQPPRKSSIQSPGSAHRAISGVPPPPATSRSNNTTTAMHDNHGSGAGVDRSPASPAPSDLSPNSAAPLPSALPPSKTQTPPPPASSNAEENIDVQSNMGYSPSYYSKDPRRASPSNQYEGSTLSPVDYASFRGQTSSVPPLHSYEHAAPAGSPSSVPSPGETVTADNITTTSGGWWESANSYGTPANSTSQPVFESITDTPIADDGSGFIDPMASFGGPSFVSPGAPMRETPHPIAPSPSSRTEYDEDEEDLGFGNGSSRKRDKRGNGSMDSNSGHTDSPSSHNNTEKNEPKSSETESGNKYGLSVTLADKRPQGAGQ
ncbi:hypothetical protein VP01_1963g2 [Puccinia sorghi]|uniref:COPII coat assembly protein SEC16 n=1 Tax=Puccinia sorghi TaxID=27349 RepID=A0A0L6VC26_9BASI|nr:hypothetical protein VP01_1963g2 [Puccinia sorghi]